MIKKISRSSWDACLDTRMCDKYNNAELTLTLKIAMKQINPNYGALNGLYPNYGRTGETEKKINQWKPSQWASWKYSFATSAQNFLNGKFWLVNNYRLLQYSYKIPTSSANHVIEETYTPNIWCKLKIDVRDAEFSTDHHHLIEVVKLDSSETFFGSHSNLFDNLDLNLTPKRRDSCGDRIMQRGHVHEVGHLGGLGHVNEGKPSCPKGSDTNASKCYGVDDEDLYSVMGSGMQLRKKQADPWREAIIALLKRGVKSNPSDWEGKLKRHYPRTRAEILLNKAITIRPHRL